ncbi:MULTISPECIES: hypothetical protein [unclassified Flavobacterium]|uniref:hypothetical protein n=1 Tax=unclassified Flavobacterium TaxID=196869 RepID=UPI001F1496B0|nr:MULTISPECIES: hypothetical protein [unclassified Flavobacterium]UMY64441.1 hypothetical protein MKO97_07945 [Flavobacterium sp. HJ-32-4]
MKIKHALFLIAAGFGLDFVGAFWKIMHGPFANILLMAALVLKITGLIALLVKLVSNTRFRDFMNQ